MLRKGLISVFVKVFAFACALVTNVVLARSLGAEGFGIFTFAYSFAVLISIPAQAGLPQLVVREVVRYRLAGQWGYVRGLMFRSWQLVVILSVILVGTVVVLFEVLSFGVEPQVRDALLIACLVIPIIAVGNINSSMLKGLDKVLVGQVPEEVVKPALFLLIVFILTFGCSLSGVFPSLLAVIASALLACLVGLGLLVRQGERLISGQRDFDTRFWLKISLPFMAIATIQIINKQMYVTLLGFLVEPEEVAYFKVAMQGGVVVSFILIAFNSVIAPSIVKLYQGGDRLALQLFITKISRFVLLGTAPLVLALLVFGERILLVVFGAEYLFALDALKVVVIAQFINAAFGSVVLLLNMTGNEKETLLGVSLAAVVGFGSTLFLVKEMGMLGAAYSYLLGMFVWNLWLCLRVRAVVGVWSLPFYFKVRS